LIILVIFKSLNALITDLSVGKSVKVLNTARIRG